MNMVIGILQPGYLPWLGFFEQLARSDIFVIYDDVQYDKHGWRNRNRIKSAHGVQWLTVPVQVSLREPPLIHEVMIDNGANWRRKHLMTIRHSYAKAPFFEQYIPLFEEAYSREWERLIDLDMHFIVKLAACMNIDTKTITRSSTLNVNGDKLERLVAICKRFGADTFYEGAAGKNYIEERLFVEQGITVMFQDYRHPVYRQLYGDFVPYLSVIDLLFNHGAESLSILTNKSVAEVSQR